MVALLGQPRGIMSGNFALALSDKGKVISFPGGAPARGGGMGGYPVFKVPF